MAGYLDAYGVDDARREKSLKRILFAILITLAVAGVAFLTLRNWGEKQRVKQFFGLLQKQDYRGAYALWGCTDAHPCPAYPFESFLEDWGPQSIASTLKMGDSET